jgi:hypothetical protein
MKNGNGKLTSANGDEYTGNFKDELFDGKVLLYTSMVLTIKESTKTICFMEKVQ